MTADIRAAILLALAVIFTADIAHAEVKARNRSVEERTIASCIRQSAAGRGWLERTLWALRDQEGGWIGAQIANTDGSHDLGPLQVNSWWVSRLAAITRRPAASVRWWLIHDACFNVEAARWIFLSGLAVTRDYWKAVGVYHSPTGWRQRRYALSVARKLSRRFGADAFSKASSSGQRRPPVQGER